MTSNASAPLKDVVNRVVAMTNYNSKAQTYANSLDLNVTTVSWEDCARNKGSCWGPCISDMTLQVGSNRMPVMREPNYTDKTWDVEMDKIPVVVGNEVSPSESSFTKLKTITLREYLTNFDQYITNAEGLKLNLLPKPGDKQKDTHVIMSSQCCFLPIEPGKETKFNVALYNYQSRKEAPAVLAIVATSKGTSAQVIEGKDQKLLFNNFGKKADFVGQRLTDNRRERGVALEGEMTKQEKQDNCIVIIQVPLVQPRRNQDHVYNLMNQCADGFGFSYTQSAVLEKKKYKKKKKRRHRRKKQEEEEEDANVEAAIVKVAEKVVPSCICGTDLSKCQVQFTYMTNAGRYTGQISCDKCGKSTTNPTEIVWHCPKKKNHYLHREGYDLCSACAEKQLKYSELNGLKTLERDGRFPIRVTLQYYKSTDNGVVTKPIMQAIKTMLENSQKQADFIGSLVTEKAGIRPTEADLSNSNSNSNNNSARAGYDKIYKALKQFGGNGWMTYYNNFVEQEVNDEDVKELTDADFSELIPKMGPRSRFKKWVNQRKQNEADTNFMNGLI